MCLALALAGLLTTSCREELVVRNLGGEMEQLNEEESKTYLGHHEQWVYWENGDDIKVDINGTRAVCNLLTGHQQLTARFQSVDGLPEGDDPVYAIYPASSFGSSYTDLIMPATMPYRDGTDATHPDSSFGRGCMPMVAYESKGADATIYFHNVCGVLRLQFYSSTGTHTIQSIEFSTASSGGWGDDKKLSGNFTVNNIETNQPYLTPVADPSAAVKTVTVTGIGKQIGPTKLLTFYLPMPAIGSESTTTTYEMWMTVKDSENKYVRKKLRAYIHRRNISMMQALDLTTFVSSGDGEATPTLVGSGTKDRPFQIYSGAELEQVRVAFANNTTINGQTIRGMDDPNGPTYFKIVRSDIRLMANQAAIDALPAAQQSNAIVWQAGITNFKGYMYFASSTDTGGTVINNSGHPLFESIGANGTVEGVFVSGSQTKGGSGSYSPFCYENNGTLIDCHNKCNVTTSTLTLAGVCAVNNGTIIGGANEGSLTSTTGNVAGICATNSSTGIIQGSFTLSSSVPVGVKIGGICYHNEGTLQNCQVSASLDPLNSTGNWGVIVYESSGTVDNCRSTGSIVISTSGSIGGICHTLTGGEIKDCTNNVTLNGATGSVGGIVSEMTGGEVYNCSAAGSHSISGTASLAPGDKADNAGGIVGYLKGGAVRNCYVRCLVSGATNTGGVLGNMDDGTTIENCWSNHTSIKVLGAIGATGTVGANCFSANAGDANVIENTFYKVTKATEASYVGQYLHVPLNDWVSSHDSKYRSWTTSEGENVYPIFVSDAKGKASRPKHKATRIRR